MKRVRYHTPASVEEARLIDPARGPFTPRQEAGKGRMRGPAKPKRRRRR